MTVTPRTDLWLRMGRTWLTANAREDLVWYKKYTSERSANSYYTLGWVAPLTRIGFSASANWVNTRERPGFEIDARSQRRELAYSAATELRALAKTLIGVRGERRKFDFDADAVFLGSNLNEQLNRTTTTGVLTLRHELTPLTSIGLSAARDQDRFESSPSRDSDSNRVDLNVKFDPAALISGSAQVGFRNFNPVSSDVPGFKGTTAAVDVGYVVGGATRLSVQMKRDVEYSFEIAQPYYLQTGFTGTIAQRLFGPVDIQARGGTASLAYANRDELEGLAQRVDHVRTYGGGIGYRMGRELRIGVNVDQVRRESPISKRHYSGLRYGTSVTYGK
jgi:hypothetical protein